MRGVLGINKRNLFYISYSKKIKRILDSKILTKTLLKKNSLPVPETLFLLKRRKEVLEFNPETLPPSFVIKPDRGFGGEGVMIIYGKSKKKNFFIKSGGEKISWEEIVFHILDPMEQTFTFKKDSLFIDMETGEKIQTEPWHIRSLYRKEINIFLEEYKRECRQHRIDYVSLNTSQPFDTALFRYLVMRKRIGG